MSGGSLTSSVRRRSASSGCGVLLAAVLGLTACGAQAPRSVATDVTGPEGVVHEQDSNVVRLAPGAQKPRLWCPGDERSLMIADFAVGARGAPTPEAAVGRAGLEGGEHMVISPSGSRVWLVRADGTAREEVHLTHLRGWFLHMRESCA